MLLSYTHSTIARRMLITRMVPERRPELGSPEVSILSPEFARERSYMKNEETRIYRLSGICVFLAAMTFIVPRLFPNPEGAFASGANAILVLLAMLVITLTFSLYLLTVTVGAYRDISKTCRAVGIGPSLVLALILLGLLGFIRY